MRRVYFVMQGSSRETHLEASAPRAKTHLTVLLDAGKLPAFAGASENNRSFASGISPGAPFGDGHESLMASRPAGFSSSSIVVRAVASSPQNSTHSSCEKNAFK